MKYSFFYWLVKSILLFNVLSSLSGCSQVCFSSKESIEAQEKKPWKEDQFTIAGGVSKSKEKITPYIGIHVPIEPDASLSQTLHENIKDPKKEEIITIIDKKEKFFQVVNEDQRWDDIPISMSETSFSEETQSSQREIK